MNEVDELKSFERNTGLAWLVPSNNPTKEPYKVFNVNLTSWICSCPNFWYRDIECKHIKVVKAQLKE